MKPNQEELNKAMLEAACRNQLDEVERLLNRGADVHTQDFSGQTLLGWAWQTSGEYNQ